MTCHDVAYDVSFRPNVYTTAAPAIIALSANVVCNVLWQTTFLCVSGKPIGS